MANLDDKLSPQAATFVTLAAEQFDRTSAKVTKRRGSEGKV